MLRRLWALIMKELRAQLRDPDSRRLLIIPVILQVAIFPLAATLEVKNTTLAVFNQDLGKDSIELIQRFSRAKAFPNIKFLHSQKEVRTVIDNKKALIAVIFPSDFSRQIELGKTGSIQIIVDGRRSNSAQIAASYVEQIVADYRTSLPVQNFTPVPLSNMVVLNAYNPNLEYQWFILPSLIALITTIGCLVVTAMSVAREREQGTFEQLLVSPLTPGYIMIGKTVPAVIIACTQASIILLASLFVYRIPFQGSILLLYFCLLCYGFALAGIGLFISSISSTQQQAFLGVFGFVMPGILLSGYIAPIENIPEPLRAITWLNPIRHFIVISKGIYLKGFSISYVWPNLWPLLIIAILSLSLAYFAFSRQAA